MWEIGGITKLMGMEFILPHKVIIKVSIDVIQDSLRTL